MSVFCKLFGHTWIPVTLAPVRRWNTTKEGHVLQQEVLEGREGSIRHLDRCVRCGAERDAGRRRLDADQVDAGAAS